VLCDTDRMVPILNLHYPTKRLLVIPVNGVLTIPTGEETTDTLPIDYYCFIDGQRLREKTLIWWSSYMRITPQR
jgi:hypothetical protein